MPSSHVWKRNDTNPIAGVLKAGSPPAAVNLQSASLRFHMFTSGGGQIVDAAASNDQNNDGSDGTKGNWSYSPAAADTDESGEFNAEVEATFPDGTIRTFPNTGYILITIHDDLA